MVETNPGARFNPAKIDQFIAMRGDTLHEHFEFMDMLLWRSISLISQVEPIYLQRRALEPAVRKIGGKGHGRRWFIRTRFANRSEWRHLDKAEVRRLKEVETHQLVGVLVDAVRSWAQTGQWADWLEGMRWLMLYRDTLRDWVQQYESHSPRIQSNINEWLAAYFKIRSEITEAYLPLVQIQASLHSRQNEDLKADLFQIGVTGLVHATERYHNSGPMTFHNFAKTWIRQRILMALSRQFPMIRVSHSVLEAQSRIERGERESGKVDTSERAGRVRQAAATRNVVLLDDIGSCDGSPIDNSPLDLSAIPSIMRKVIIIRHEVLDHANANHPPDDLRQERLRQVEAYSQDTPIKKPT